MPKNDCAFGTVSVLNSEARRSALENKLAYKAEIAAIRSTVARLSRHDFDSTSEFIQSAAFDARLAISGIQDESLRNMIVAAQPSLEIASSAAAVLAATTVHNRAAEELAALHRSIAYTARATAETQALLTALAASTVVSDDVSALTSSLTDLAAASATVWESVPRVVVAGIEALSGWLVEGPVVQTYEAARSIAYIAGVEEDSDLDAGEPAVLYRPEAADIVAKIATVGEEFVVLYNAAVDAVDSMRPDYARQAAVALRELLDHLLRRLAPDTAVKAYPKSAAFLPNQDRKARLRFLFRNILDGAYADFVDRDIDLILQTFHALHKAVHTLENPYTEAEVRLLLTRVKGNIAMILMVAQIDGQLSWN